MSSFGSAPPQRLAARARALRDGGVGAYRPCGGAWSTSSADRPTIDRRTGPLSAGSGWYSKDAAGSGSGEGSGSSSVKAIRSERSSSRSGAAWSSR
ncbi:hypothetical protein [Kitasatospora paranensis]|uniref:hypothetical protein n=1 Tax=Kitasatospora paranensis TaxID=258053 RepID=UPI0031ED319F